MVYKSRNDVIKSGLGENYHQVSYQATSNSLKWKNWKRVLK